MRSRPLTTLVAVILLVAASATAQETFSNQEARARFEEGTKLADTSDYERARVKFLQAYALEQRPSILTNLAVCEQKTNRLLEAIDHAEQYLAHPQADARRSAAMRQLLDQLSRGTAKVHVVGPSGLAIVIDGAAKGRTPSADLHLLPGKHTVAVGETTREMTLAAGETQNVDVTPTTAPPPPTEHATTKWMPPPTGAIILGGVGLVGLGLGIGLGAASSGQRSDLDAKAKASGGICAATPAAPACVDLRSARDGAQTTATLSVVGYVAGGALLAGGIVWWLLAPRTVSERVSVTPLIGPSFGGAATAVRF